MQQSRKMKPRKIPTHVQILSDPTHASRFRNKRCEEPAPTYLTSKLNPKNHQAPRATFVAEVIANKSDTKPPGLIQPRFGGIEILRTPVRTWLGEKVNDIVNFLACFNPGHPTGHYVFTEIQTQVFNLTISLSLNSIIEKG